VVAAYRKPGTLWRALDRVLGPEVLDRALHVFTERWLLRHPTPFDLFHTIEDVAGRELDWFWTPWFYDTVVLDQAIVSVQTEPAAAGGAGERVTVVIEDLGGAPMPVEIEFMMADETTQRVTLPVEPWLEGATRQWTTVELPLPVARVMIDPDRYFPDVDRANNVWFRR
jgi:aminopeptidase N